MIYIYSTVKCHSKKTENSPFALYLTHNDIVLVGVYTVHNAGPYASSGLHPSPNHCHNLLGVTVNSD